MTRPPHRGALCVRGAGIPSLSITCLSGVQRQAGTGPPPPGSPLPFPLLLSSSLPHTLRMPSLRPGREEAPGGVSKPSEPTAACRVAGTCPSVLSWSPHPRLTGWDVTAGLGDPTEGREPAFPTAPAGNGLFSQGPLPSLRQSWWTGLSRGPERGEPPHAGWAWPWEGRALTAPRLGTLAAKPGGSTLGGSALAFTPQAATTSHALPDPHFN